MKDSVSGDTAFAFALGLRVARDIGSFSRRDGCCHVIRYEGSARGVQMRLFLRFWAFLQNACSKKYHGRGPLLVVLRLLRLKETQ